MDDDGKDGINLGVMTSLGVAIAIIFGVVMSNNRGK